MKKATTTLFMLLAAMALVGVPAATAQSAGKIIDRYKKASGGNAIKRIRTTMMLGSLKLADGTTGRFTYQTQKPDRLRVDMEAGATKTSECYNGKSAWRMDHRGLRTLLGSEAKRLRLEALLASNRLQDLSRYRIVPQTPIKTSADGLNAYSVELIKDGVRVRMFFDVTTRLLVKQERERSEGLEEIYYADHRQVDGVMEPHSLRIKSGSGEYLVSFERVLHNSAVDEMAFRYPKVEGERPLPNVEAMMKAIIANQEKVEELLDRYTYREIRTERKDDNGKVKEGETRVFEITPVHGISVRRLLSVNGKDLSPSEREKEDRRVQKEVEDLIKDHEKRERKEQQARDRGREEDDNDDRISLLSFLRISEITSVRREIFRGHEVIAFDFEPRKGYKPRNRAESLVNKLAGTMWVDEEARQVARAEARLTDSFKIGGGLLASLSPTSAIVFEQEKIGDEVWLPSYGEVNLSARVFLVAKFKRNYVTIFSDYKKYHIDDRYELGKPKESKPDSKP